MQLKDFKWIVLLMVLAHVTNTMPVQGYRFSAGDRGRIAPRSSYFYAYDDDNLDYADPDMYEDVEDDDLVGLRAFTVPTGQGIRRYFAGIPRSPLVRPAETAPCAPVAVANSAPEGEAEKPSEQCAQEHVQAVAAGNPAAAPEQPGQPVAAAATTVMEMPASRDDGCKEETPAAQPTAVPSPAQTQGQGPAQAQPQTQQQAQTQPQAQTQAQSQPQSQPQSQTQQQTQSQPQQQSQSQTTNAEQTSQASQGSSQTSSSDGTAGTSQGTSTDTATGSGTDGSTDAAAGPGSGPSSGSSGDASDQNAKTKELHTMMQHLYIAQARVQLEAAEIRKAQGVANAAQEELEEASNKVRAITAALQTAQQAVASAAIRAQTAQLLLDAHDQLLFAARQDVDALSSHMVGLQAMEGIAPPRATFDVAGLLERLKQPLPPGEKPTAIPPVAAMPQLPKINQMEII